MTDPLADPIEEGKRVIGAASQKGVTMRLLGGVAVVLQSPSSQPLLSRPIGDIDVATRKGNRKGVTEVLTSAGYVPDEMFNTVHAATRLLFYDEANRRKLDVFIGDFAMCHTIPIADRLERDPLTIPLAELLLTKLQIVELNERDQRDIYNLTYHHAVSSNDGTDIDGDYIAAICAQDWGLWRTSKATIERCRNNLQSYALDDASSALILERLEALWTRIEAAPKTARWRLRSRVGDRVRWYAEPEENQDSA